MKSNETSNYVFYYRENSAAERDILRISQIQQACCKHICAALNVSPDFKIRYFLCETPEEVGHLYGDDEPCNGFASPPDAVYAVYNEDVQCIGFHEDAHILSYLLNRPDSPAIREGLAMYFDRKWWGIDNLDWTAYFVGKGSYIPIGELMQHDVFFSVDCSVTYPIAGAFTDWLISAYGMEKYLRMYKGEAIGAVYQSSLEELDRGFLDYVKLFKTDPAILRRMEEMRGE